MLTEQNSRQRHRSILFLLFLSFLTLAKSDELQLLLKFKSSLQKSNTNVFDSWREDYSICSFKGITCNSNGLVKEIELPSQELVGVLPFDSLCQLQSLEKISLGMNYLHGSLTEHLKNCTQLQYLDLGFNLFTGQVPDLSTLSELKLLSLNASGFSGQFPWKSLENLTKLEFLSLGDNPFHTTTSFPIEVLNLDKLYWLYLTNCSLMGQIPAGISNLTHLQNIELSYNELSGDIPASIAKLQNLTQLEIYSNKLTGKLPVGFGNLTSLVNLDLSTNFLEGDLSELRFLRRLASIQLFENRFSGIIPAEFGDELKDLVNLSLYTNNLTGPLPQKLGSWTDFNYIDVAENSLSGPIPPDMCKNGKMTDLLILQNNFTGSIPANYGNCSSLVRLRVSNNLLSGIVPQEIWGLRNLTIIDLASNQFQGPVSSSIGSAKSLAQLFIANNQFSSDLPATISKASNLHEIELSSNKFSGEIPSTIGDLKYLNSLHLEDNMFSGSIPSSLTSCSSLSDINLAGNALSGGIPVNIGSLSNLNSLNLSNNQLSGEIPSSMSSMRLSLFDLSNNLLIGRIPESLEPYKSSFSGNPGLCSQNIKNFRPCSSDSGGNSNSELRIVMTCLVAGVSVLIVLLSCLIFTKLRKKNQDRPIKQDSWDLKPYRALTFTEQEIVKAIKHENLIGKGGSGNVYKVVLNNGQILAAKHIWKSDSDDPRATKSSTSMLKLTKVRSPEYDAEVATLSAVRHVNVVKLYCSITGEDSDVLVYEYMCNGSLWDRMHTWQKMEMGWDTRYEIAVGSARGLEYLHHGCDRPVIHRDVKSSNILLDEDLKPKIADFGLAKTARAVGGWDSTHVIAGTHGYIAPEYAYTSKVNEKSDVYSFGVVLLELVTGKRPMEPEFGENKDIVYWVCNKMWSKENIHDLVDKSISMNLKEDAMKVLKIGIHCTAKIPALRPSMRTVVQMLEEAKPFKLDEIIVKREGENSQNVGLENGCKIG